MDSQILAMTLNTILAQAAQARALGLTRFLTSEPCKRGHRAERRTCDGCCVACRGPIRTRHANPRETTPDDVWGARQIAPARHAALGAAQASTQSRMLASSSRFTRARRIRFRWT